MSSAKKEELLCAPVKKAVVTSAAAASASPVVVLFQCKPRAEFKRWSELSQAAPRAPPPVDPVRRILSFGDDDSLEDGGDARVEERAIATATFDPELDDSRDGLPLLLKQTRLPAAMEGVHEDAEDEAGDAPMETSRDRGVKRKEAPAPAATPRNSPQKSPATQPTSVWNQRTPALTRLFGLEVKAQAALSAESGAKKQKRSPTQSAAFVAPVAVRRVTRSAWKRINDGAQPAAARQSPQPRTSAPMPPPSPSLPAIKSGRGPAAAPVKKTRVVVTKKDAAAHSAPSSTPTTAASSSASSSPSTTPLPPSPSASAPTAPASPPPPPSPRTLARRLSQRQKQLDMGKATTGYQRYLAAVPRHLRIEPLHPKTPQPRKQCSKRSWDGQVRKWRRALHLWDPEGEGGDVDSELGSEVASELTSELPSEVSARAEEGESELGSELGVKAEDAEPVMEEPAMVKAKDELDRAAVEVGV